MLPAALLYLLASCSVQTSPHCQADVVHLGQARSESAGKTVEGKVLEYTGEKLVIELKDGSTKEYSGKFVRRIETDFSAPQVDADRLANAGDLDEALKQYQAAIRKENRAWVRRIIVTRMIAVHRFRGDYGSAARLFLSLIEEDPKTPYFAAIPLDWISGKGSLDPPAQTADWLRDEKNDVAALIGSSLQVNGPLKSEAVERLGQLTKSQDRRVVPLAQAQLWRVREREQSLKKIQEWAARLDSLPDELRPGPTFVVGKALLSKKSPEHALALLWQIPTLFPDERVLASEALFTLGNLHEQRSELDAASVAYHELELRFPGTLWAKEAQKRSEALSAKGSSGTRASTSILPAGDTLQERYLQALRQRRLFTVAEAYCQLKLAAAPPNSLEQARLHVERSILVAEQALLAKPSDQESLWKASLEIPAAFAKDNPDHPRLVLLKLQEAMIHALRGENLRAQSELRDHGQLEPARQSLRTAADLLKSVDEEINRLIAKAARATSADKNSWNSDELRDLQQTTQFQQAKTYVSQGRCYEPLSPDFVNSLSRGVELFAPFETIPSERGLDIEASLATIACQRMLRNFSEGDEGLNRLLERVSQVDQLGRANAEAIRLQTDRGQLDRATALAEKYSQELANSSPEMDIAILELQLAQWQSAHDDQDQQGANTWQEQAAAQAQTIQAAHGPFWSQRAELLLANTFRTSGGGDAGLLTQTAAGLYRGGQLEAAMNAYDQARIAAEKDGDSSSAFKSGYAAALIQQELGDSKLSSKKMEEIAGAYPAEEQAAEAHLQAIYLHLTSAQGSNQAELTKDDVDRQFSLLENHLRLWPDSESALQARLWKGRLHARQHQWEQAIAELSLLPFDTKDRENVPHEVLESYLKWLTELSRQGKSVEQPAMEAYLWFLHVVKGDRNTWPEKWTAPQREAALGAALMHERFGIAAPQEVIDLLKSALEDVSDVSEDWANFARGVLVTVLARGGRSAESAALMQEISQGSAANLWGMVQKLQQMAEDSSADSRNELAQARLTAIELLRSSDRRGKSPEDWEIDLAEIRALADQGKGAESLDQLEKLAQAHPTKGEVQEALAILLYELIHDDDSRQQAMTKWKSIAKKSKSGSNRWIRSQYYIASMLYQQKEYRSALSTIQVVQRQYPELGGSTWKAKFEDLAARCRSR